MTISLVKPQVGPNHIRSQRFIWPSTQSSATGHTAPVQHKRQTAARYTQKSVADGTSTQGLR